MANYEVFTLERAEIEYAANITANKAKEWGYFYIVEETMALAKKRSKSGTQRIRDGFLQTPPVNFIVDTTLTTLSQPSVEARLPREVWRRGCIAAALSRIIGLKEDNAHLYENMFAYYDGIPDFAIPTMLDTKSHSNLSSNVFRENTFAIGGALKFLNMHGVTEQQSQIIKDSITIPKKIGACAGYRMTPMYEKLGDPYVLPEHLRLHTNKNKGMTIGFGRVAKLLLDELQLVEPGKSTKKTDGCSAMFMPSPKRNNQTILIDSWHQMVDFLAPPGATADALPGSAVPYEVVGCETI